MSAASAFTASLPRSPPGRAETGTSAKFTLWERCVGGVHAMPGGKLLRVSCQALRSTRMVLRCACSFCAPCAGRRCSACSQLPGSRLQASACPRSTYAGCRAWTWRAATSGMNTQGRARWSGAHCSGTSFPQLTQSLRLTRGSGTSSSQRTTAALPAMYPWST